MVFHRRAYTWSCAISSHECRNAGQIKAANCLRLNRLAAFFRRSHPIIPRPKIELDQADATLDCFYECIAMSISVRQNCNIFGYRSTIEDCGNPAYCQQQEADKNASTNRPISAGSTLRDDGRAENRLRPSPNVELASSQTSRVRRMVRSNLRRTQFGQGPTPRD